MIYSNQCKAVCFSESKYNNHRHATYYYHVDKSDYEKMEVKPKLERVVRPMELSPTGFGYGEITAQKVIGEGWEERVQVYECSVRKIFFVV